MKSYYQQNKEKILAKAKLRYQKNKETKKLYSRKYYKKNKSRINKARKTEEYRKKARIYAKIKYKENPEYFKLSRIKAKDYRKKYHKKYWPKYRKKNKSKLRANKARYKYKKKKATPKWLTKRQWKEIDMFYIKATEMTTTYKVEYEVDHIIPIQGKNVSGLHVPWNLQILTREQNRDKTNKHET